MHCVKQDIDMKYVKLVHALRESAARIKDGAKYEWGHVGRCNCGHLIQSVCGLNDHEIYSAFHGEVTEWSEHANEYCNVTGKPLELVLSNLEEIGFSRNDVLHLENLSDKKVLDSLPKYRRHLRKNDAADVALYMETMAELLEK